MCDCVVKRHTASKCGEKHGAAPTLAPFRRPTTCLIVSLALHSAPQDRGFVPYRSLLRYPRACIAQASININDTMHCDSVREPKRSFLVDDQGQGTAEKAERALSLNPLAIRGLLLMNRVTGIWHIHLRRGTHLSCPTHAVVAQRADAPVRSRCLIPLPLGRNGETQGFLFAMTD